MTILDQLAEHARERVKAAKERLETYRRNVERALGAFAEGREYEDAAKAAAAECRPEEIQWFDGQDNKPPFLVTYAEPLE